MRAVDQLELVVAPGGPLRALVLTVANLDRRLPHRLGRRRGVENELDHLPVTLVQVVPVVEDVEEPVLERELPRAPGLGRDVRVDGRGLTPDELALPAEVVAARLERAPGEVEVVLEEALREVIRGRTDLDQVALVPRAAQRDGRLAEEQVDVDRKVGFSWAQSVWETSLTTGAYRLASSASCARSAAAAGARTSAPRARSVTGSRRIKLWLRGEQVQVEPAREERSGELSLDAVPGNVEQRRERAEAALAGSDGDDAAADAALAGENDVVEPIP